MKKPSVTELTELLDKPALMKWANKLGLNGLSLDAYRLVLRTRGTSYHSKIESFVSSGELSDDEEFNKQMISFFKDKEVLGSEVSIENEHFTGRYDIRFKYKDKIYLGDFKSNKKKRVYLENKLQLSAYSMADTGIPCVIFLPSLSIVEVSINDLHKEFILTLCKLYNLKQQLDA